MRKIAQIASWRQNGNTTRNSDEILVFGNYKNSPYKVRTYKFTGRREKLLYGLRTINHTDYVNAEAGKWIVTTFDGNPLRTYTDSHLMSMRNQWINPQDDLRPPYPLRDIQQELAHRLEVARANLKG
jgi:hypothetical protein